MAKVRITLEIKLNEEVIKGEGHTAHDVYKDLQIVSDDVVDGYVITRNGDTGDITSNFYYDGVAVINQEFVEGDE